MTQKEYVKSRKIKLLGVKFLKEDGSPTTRAYTYLSLPGYPTPAIGTNVVLDVRGRLQIGLVCDNDIDPDTMSENITYKHIHDVIDPAQVKHAIDEMAKVVGK